MNKAAGAHAIVSGDAHLLDLGAYEGVQIMTPALPRCAWAAESVVCQLAYHLHHRARLHGGPVTVSRPHGGAQLDALRKAGTVR